MKPCVAENPANCCGKHSSPMFALRYTAPHIYHVNFHRSISNTPRNRILAFSSSTNGVKYGVLTNSHQEVESSGEDIISTKFVAETLLPTVQGKFRLRGYRHTRDGGITYTEPTAIISGHVEGQSEVVVRVHDACFTSEVLGSLKCDCREQLNIALQYIHGQPPGMVIYLHQEGRGIGLANKIAAYALQEKGLDTVDANRALGLPDDCREYSAVKHILNELGITSIRLMTNNPRKINELEALGITVTDRVPCIVQSTEYNASYLSVKQSRMDHMLMKEGKTSQEEEELAGQFCYWNHGGEPSASGIPLDPGNDQGMAVLAEISRSTRSSPSSGLLDGDGGKDDGAA